MSNQRSQWPALKACPFCGGAAVGRHEWQAVVAINYVECTRCEAQGGADDSPESAARHWNRRAEHSASVNHIADAGEMVQGDVVSMGDLEDETGTLYELSFLLKFSSVEDFHAAMKAGQCRFTVFGGEV